MNEQSPVVEDPVNGDPLPQQTDNGPSPEDGPQDLPQDPEVDLMQGPGIDGDEAVEDPEEGEEEVESQ